MKLSIDYTIETANYLNKTFSNQTLFEMNLSSIDVFKKNLPSKLTELYNNKLIFSLFPFLLKTEDKQYIEKACLSMHKILEKIIETFLEKKEPVFSFYKKYDSLISLMCKKEEYYQKLVRYDFIINDNGIFFYEINGCLPGGFFVYDSLSELSLNAISTILNRKIISTFKMDNFYSLVFKLIALYSSTSMPLSIGLIYDDYNFDYEFKIIQERLKQKGLNVEILHIKDIKHINKKILVNHKNIYVVYNNFFIADSQINIDDIKWINVLTSEPYKKLITSSRNGNLSLMHGLAQMTIGEDKSIFALLSDPKFINYFDDKEIEFISKHIPYTRRLTDLEIQNKFKFVQEKDNYILKKYYSQLGSGVYKGKNYSESEWINILDKYHNQSILQRKIEPLKYSFFDPRYNKGYRYMETNLSMSMYIVDGQCSGLIAHLEPHGDQSLLQPVFEVM